MSTKEPKFWSWVREDRGPWRLICPSGTHAEAEAAAMAHPTEGNRGEAVTLPVGTLPIGRCEQLPHKPVSRVRAKPVHKPAEEDLKSHSGTLNDQVVEHASRGRGPLLAGNSRDVLPPALGSVVGISPQPFCPSCGDPAADANDHERGY
jgi:hypothetical protein